MALTIYPKTLRRQQLDRLLLSGSINLRDLPTPKRGWLREIREALGLSAQQLARRLGVLQSAVSKMEQAEVERTITLRRLQMAAEAMDCDLVYCFVPRRSLDEIVREQAGRRAEELFEDIGHSMALEDQRLISIQQKQAISELTDELARTTSRDLWKEECSK
ncbi:MAG TPA: mobile mystery protein A [Chthonomonadaceae bacterium]|nr:mobile mystery protein A [Chthonomonadaceae bacterium]